MGSDIDSVLLSLLGHEPSIPGQLGATGGPNKETDLSPIVLSINGIEYNLLGSTVDLLLRHTSSSLQAARVILAVRKAVGDERTSPKAPEEEEEERSAIEFAAHTFSHPQDSTPVPRTSIIIDADALRASSQPTAVLRASTISTNPRPAPQTNPGRTLRDTYHSYIAAINAGAVVMTSHLAEFCHPVVTHNGQALSLPQYQRLMQDAQEAIPGMTFQIADLIADEEEQQVAARLEFTGTPAKTWAGVEPNGKGVNFSEHVFYWFEEGKIRSVVSLVDMEAYRNQMRA